MAIGAQKDSIYMINEKLQLKEREQFDSKAAHKVLDFKEADFSVGPIFLEYVFFFLIAWENLFF